MISFKRDIQLEIIDDYDDDDNIIASHNKTFKAGEPVDADIVDVENNGLLVTLQFGGSGGLAKDVLSANIQR